MRIVEEIRQCCHSGCSFFYLVNHGIDQNLIDDVEEIMRAAFSLPTDQKCKIDKRLSPHFRGWERAGLEMTEGRADPREQIDMWSDFPSGRRPGKSEHEDRLLGPSQYFGNDVLPGYERLTKAWMAGCCGVCEKLLEGENDGANAGAKRGAKRGAERRQEKHTVGLAAWR